MGKTEKDNQRKYYMLSYFFDSGKVGDSFYGNTIFGQIIKGKELVYNNYKTVFSVGDVLNDDIYDDISPFVINDNLCTVNRQTERYSDYLFAIVIEDIELEIAKKIDTRLKTDCSAYIGMTSIDVESTDERKQFWKRLIRLFSIEGETITCFGEEERGFSYWEMAKVHGFRLNYDGFPYDNECWDRSDLFSTRQSSFISQKEQLQFIEGHNDSDRGISEMNFALVKEVEISGVQIWKAIEDINHAYISKKRRDTIVDYIFTSLYQAAQGVERLLKILIELIVYENSDIDKVKTDKLLRSHNHVAMYEFVAKKKGLSFNKNCNNLLNILANFYSSARYSRYSYSNDNVLELHLLQTFGKDIPEEDFDEKIKHLYGKTLGQIAHGIYKLIMSLSYELNIYVYELNAESVAQFALYESCDEDLYEILKQIEQAKKEFLWYIIKNGSQFQITKMLDEIEPLSFDYGDVHAYMSDIITNENSCYMLHDFVDTAYDELVAENKTKWKERLNTIKYVIGNKYAYLWGEEAEECE